MVTIRGSRDVYDQQRKASSQQCQSRGHNGIRPCQYLHDTGNENPPEQHSIPVVMKENTVLDTERGRSAEQALSEPVKKDHKSFIQNLFGTVAFKMIELLTPSSLEAMIFSNHVNFSRSEEHAALDNLDVSKPLTSTELDSKSQELINISSGNNASTPNSELASTFAPVSRADSESSFAEDGQVAESEPVDNISSKPHSAKSGTQRPRRSRDLGDPLSQTIPSIKQLNGFPATEMKDRGAIENGASKLGRFSNQTMLPDEAEIQKTHSTENYMTAPRKPQRRHISALGSLGNSLDQEVLSYQGGHQHPSLHNIRRISTNRSSSCGVDINTETIKEEFAKDPKSDLLNSKSPYLCNRDTSVIFANPPPKSLSMFSIEIIDALSNIMQNINAPSLESLSIKFPYPRSGLQRAKKNTLPGHLDSDKLITYKPEQHAKSQWKDFIEQSLFYVLSCPTTLLKSFSEDGLLFDTQTLWYSMMRLVSMASPLVFDSLWVAASSLYIRPQQLCSKNNLVKDPLVKRDRAGIGYTTDQAAELISICLHALIAAVPYSSDANELYEISRMRAYGLFIPHSRPCPTKISEMCLLHEDIFSNELALRLARRVFAAIPARRQFQEAMAHNTPEYNPLSPPTDILDLVLAPLNFLHIEVPSILDFSLEDRILHKKRVPILLIDWARTVILQEWSGRPEVTADGCLGGALAMISALYHKRKALFLGDDIFRIDYLADSMDGMQMPIEWLSFTSDKKTVHLLDHPYLFGPSTLVTYFRAINYSRMSRSYEESTSKRSRVESNLVYGYMLHDQRRREALLRRLPIATSKFLVLQIRRDHVLADAFDQLWRREERELSRPLKVRLGEDSGEEGFDSGGVQQEFFRLAIAEALDPDFGAFTIDDRTKMTWFQPGSPEPVWKFELIGLIISLAIYNGLTLPITFPKCLYRKLLDDSVTELEHIEDGWPELASGLSCLLGWDEANGSVSDVFCRTYEFSVESFGQQISRDMASATHWPQFSESSNRNTVDDNPADARLVDSRNRNDYVRDYIQWLTDISIRPQYEAFQRGFYTCLERRSLALFDTDTLQSVVEGVQDIDISEMRKYTRYVGWGANHRTIKDFWSITKKYSTEEKKKLLEFVTASDRLPVGGMKNLQFVIQRHGVGDIDGHLPTSYTCFGTLLLPEYSTKEVLRDKLGMALENSKGFGFA